jgi:ribosome-associated protein
MVPRSASLPRRRRPPGTHEPQDEVPNTAVARRSPERLAQALDRARHCARIADENRGEEILLLDLRAATPLVDYFVIVSTVSRRQALAIAGEIDQEMKKLGERKLGIEGSEEGRWILLDYGDFVIHVFSQEARAYYALEEIWGDAPRLDWWREPEPHPDRPTLHIEPAG